MTTPIKTIVAMTDGTQVELATIHACNVPVNHPLQAYEIQMLGSAILLEGPNKGKMTSIILNENGTGTYSKDVYYPDNSGRDKESKQGEWRIED
jgi:hypothetical protein